LNRTALGLRFVFCFALLSAAAALAQLPAYTQAGPVPRAILAAKTIFVSNGGSDSGLFPEPFSGDPNRAYTQFYAALKAAGHFEFAADPIDADLVLELQLMAPNGPTNGSKVYGASDPLPMFRLVIYDRKTHYVLWVMTESIEAAIGQKNHDHTFDNALNALVQDFETLAGKAPTAGH